MWKCSKVVKKILSKSLCFGRKFLPHVLDIESSGLTFCNENHTFLYEYHGIRTPTKSLVGRSTLSCVECPLAGSKPEQTWNSFKSKQSTNLLICSSWFWHLPQKGNYFKAISKKILSYTLFVGGSHFNKFWETLKCPIAMQQQNCKFM